METIKKPRTKSQRQLLVEALLGDKISNCNWPKEMAILSRLLKNIDNFDFWFYFAKKYTNFPSLVVVSTIQDVIHAEWNNYNKNYLLQVKTSPEETRIPANKVGEDIIIERPKTLMDFIK